MPQLQPRLSLDLWPSKDPRTSVDLDDEIVLQQPYQGVKVDLTFRYSLIRLILQVSRQGRSIMRRML